MIDPVRTFLESADAAAASHAPTAAWSDLRAAGRERFRAIGLPGRKTEAWKYTNLNRLTKIPFGWSAPMVAVALPAGLTNVAAPRAVLVDGYYRPELSDLSGLPAGASLFSLAHAPPAAPFELGALASLDGRPFAALNAAFTGHGLVLRVGRGVSVERPIHFVSLASGAGDPYAFHPRILAILEEGARATLFERHAAIGGGVYLANHVLEARLAQGAHFTHVKCQSEGAAAFHVAFAGVEVGPAARYDGFLLQRGGLLARHEVHLRLAGEAAIAHLGGVYLGRGEQHLDNSLTIEHAAPGQTSRVLFKGVLDETAHGVFQGKIMVGRAAQRTDAYELSRALLLSRGAAMDSKPELEIYADDVKCGHGAAVGELDAAELFYLRSRGIGLGEARRLLIEAFLSEPVEALPEGAVRDDVRSELGLALAGLAPAGGGV
jgi:Fe-S cluster assembly protein SufD